MSYEAEQQNRMNRAKYESMRIINLDTVNKTCIIENSTHDSFYTVSMNDCTCPDFQKRGVPCKHIYKLRFALGDSISPKSKPITLLLCVLFGYFGAHYFYVGRFGMGILYFFTAGFFGFGWLYDIYRIFSNQFSDCHGFKIT